MRITARFFVPMALATSFVTPCVTNHGDPIGDLVVKAVVFPIKGDSPLSVQLHAKYSWVNGIGTFVDFYLWTQNGDTISNFSDDTVIIKEAGSYDVCLSAGNVEREIEATDCKLVTVY